MSNGRISMAGGESASPVDAMAGREPEEASRVMSNNGEGGS